MVQRRIVQKGKPAKKKEVEPVTLVKYMPEPFHTRACKDYSVLTSKEQKRVFGEVPIRKYIDESLTDSFVYSLLRQLKALDILDNSIPFRDRHNIGMEIINSLSRNLAYYRAFPQRFAHHPRNCIASILMLLVDRLQRYRFGHKLESMGQTKYPLSKKKFGYVIDFVLESEYIWMLSEVWERSYHRRVRQGYTDPL